MPPLKHQTNHLASACIKFDSMKYKRILVPVEAITCIFKLYAYNKNINSNGLQLPIQTNNSWI